MRSRIWGWGFFPLSIHLASLWMNTLLFLTVLSLYNLNWALPCSTRSLSLHDTSGLQQSWNIAARGTCPSCYPAARACVPPVPSCYPGLSGCWFAGLGVKKDISKTINTRCQDSYTLVTAFVEWEFWECRRWGSWTNSSYSVAQSWYNQN